MDLFQTHLNIFRERMGKYLLSPATEDAHLVGTAAAVAWTFLYDHCLFLMRIDREATREFIDEVGQGLQGLSGAPESAELIALRARLRRHQFLAQTLYDAGLEAIGKIHAAELATLRAQESLLSPSL
jgi:hypothetical protein